MLKWTRQRPWRRGQMPASSMAKHAIQYTGATLNPNWDHVLYPPDLPDLIYPARSTFRLGHSMEFPPSFSQTDTERRCLDRILTVISHQNPDVEYCPLLVVVMAVMLKFTDPSRAYAVGQAMIDASRNRPANTIWMYFPVTAHGFIQAVSALQQLCKFNGQAADMNPLLSGEILVSFPLQTQLQILACYFAEGYKIMYRMAIVCMDKCRFSNSDHVSYPELKRYCSNVSLDKQLKRMFRYRLSRSEIALFIESAAISYDQRQEMDHHRQNVHWPEIDKIRSISHIISAQLWINIWAYVLPSRLTDSTPALVFCTARDGYSFLTMTRRVTSSPCSIVVADDMKNILGICFPGGFHAGPFNGSEIILFSFFGKFHCLRLFDAESDDDSGSTFCSMDNSLSFIMGKKLILSISDSMSKGVVSSALFHSISQERSELREFTIHHIEIISHS